MRTVSLVVLFLGALFFSTANAETPPKKPEVSPIPYLPWEDIKALYPPNRYPRDWDCPKIKNLPHQDDLIERCRQDLKISLKRNPNPFDQSQALPPGKLLLRSINKDPENRIIYFVFSYHSELITDLFVVYYYDPAQDRLILKSTR